MVSMDWVIWLVLIFFSTYAAAGLFTVQAEFKGDVVMGCSFPPPSLAALTGIKVTWHWIAPDGIREVYRMDNGEEQLTTQDPDYLGRAKLLKEELPRGWAKLQVSDLKISDSGKYHCFVQTEAGKDYKILNLSVSAPFKTIDKRIERIPEREEVTLTCQSEGYPQTEVTWFNDGQQLQSKPPTTTVRTVEQLYKITSQINVTSLDKKNYTCNFTDHAATFEIPDDIALPAEKNNVMIVVLSLAVTLALIILIFVLCKCHHEELWSVTCRNLVVDALDRILTSSSSSSSVKETKKELINEEEKTKMNASTATNNDCLKTILKDHHLQWIQTLPSYQRDMEGPFPILYTNDGRELNLHNLVPKNGDALLLEGSTGSGKTTLARMLVQSWTQQSASPTSDLPDLSHLQLVVYVDGSDVSGDLFGEIVKQLSLEEVLSEDDVKNMLTDETLLIVDGYQEGNLLFDESLKDFLLERRGCKVLITAGLGHSKIKDIVGTGAIVRVQRQCQKY